MAGYAADVQLDVKLCPRNLQGVLPLASATAVHINTASRAWKPLPPGNVRLNGQSYSAWPASIVGDATLTWSHRNRVAQPPGSDLISQDTVGTFVVEGTLTVEALVDGVVKRTWAGLTGTSQVYTLAQRTADNVDLTRPVSFRITPVNGAFTGTIRTTPPFTMS